MKACESRGTRSISDLARCAVQEFIKPRQTETDQQIIEMMKALRTVLDDIASTIKHLAPADTAGSVAAAVESDSDQTNAASLSAGGHNS